MSTDKTPQHKCADCGKVIDVTKDAYWASCDLRCDACYQSYPLCEDEVPANG